MVTKSNASVPRQSPAPDREVQLPERTALEASVHSTLVQVAQDQTATKKLHVMRNQDAVNRVAKAQRPTVAGAKEVQTMAVEQSLDSLVLYNDASGLLVMRNYDAGMKMLIWWDADARYKVINSQKYTL